MANEKKQPNLPMKTFKFIMEGSVQREKSECQPGELKLAAYVFDQVGSLLGSQDVDGKGNYNVAMQLTKPVGVDLIIGPADMPNQILLSSAFRKSFKAEFWKPEGELYRIKFDTILPVDMWLPWWPLRICISGHVRKVVHNEGNTSYCPVPFVKVEIFDVDREFCYWPYLRKWWDVLLDRPVYRIPELLKDPRIPHKPFPEPDPLPYLNPGQYREMNIAYGKKVKTLTKTVSDPQSEISNTTALQQNSARVGEARLIDSSIAARLDKLTLTSKIAPWFIFPRCYYSKAEVCETTTNCSGYFNCCFKWWPFHVRYGRLRFDSRPDIIIKVTQVINGVSTVVYLDPYTSTRWNVNSTHIDLFLDNEEVICGNGSCYTPPAGSPVFFTHIGYDDVFKINQTTGLFNFAPYTNVAYGHTLFVYGQFGDNLTRSDPVKGLVPPYYFYRLSYAKQGSSDTDFKFIDVDLRDTRVDKATLTGQSHKLGPYLVNTEPCLYEVRNFNDYYWYNPDWIAIWHSWLAEEDTGTYILRLEVFDSNGNKINSAAGTVDYRNGAGIGIGIPPAPLPTMVNHCDLVITLDNKRPVAEITVPTVINECGVIPWSAVPPLNFYVNASQENNRLHEWQFWYTKGVGSEQLLDSRSSNNGLPGNYTNHLVTGDSLLTGLNSTCAFALRLRAVAHVRNGRDFIYDDQDIDAIAIEKCPPCPPVVI